jgi:molybdenum cofactor cytidylyltransferase
VTAVRVCAVLLAAGRGSRFHGATHKLLTPLGGEPIWKLAVTNALAGASATSYLDVIVVTGAADLRASVDSLPRPAGVRVHVIDNSDWADGQASSLQCGITVATSLGADVVVVGLADQPFVDPLAWRRVAEAAQHELATPIITARYADGTWPNPVSLHSSTWASLPTTGDSGARDLLRNRPQWVTEVECVGSGADIDTVEDLRSWTS